MSLCPSCLPLQNSTSSYGHAHLVADGTVRQAPDHTGFLGRETLFLCHCSQCDCAWCFGTDSAQHVPHWFQASPAAPQLRPGPRY